ncbi:MAG: hypothetical protein OEZ38_07060, partial [Gammaproteobacteria bacterium]|nr:hypothetical protein [Gammaproteobacteria bacterium]
ANRGGGVFTSEVIVPNVSGINTNAVYINDCIGKPVIDLAYDLDDIKRTPTLLKFFAFTDVHEGIVKKVQGIDKLSIKENVLKVKMLIHPGDIISGISSGADRHGMIIVTGSTLSGAREELMNAIDLLEVTIEGN